jgi:transcription-repair coupling factor (superfamily II helicase)
VNFLPADTVVVEWDPLNLAQELLKHGRNRRRTEAGWMSALGRQRAFANLFPCCLVPPDQAAEVRFQVARNDGLAQELAQAGAEAGRLVPALAHLLEDWRQSGFHLVLVCLSQHRAQRLARLLQEEGLDGEIVAAPTWEPGPRLEITVGEISGGFRLLSQGLIVLTEDEALGFRPEGRRRKESRPPQYLTSLEDLSEGDHIVHLDHGIGIYRGLVKLRVGQEVNDFLEIEYQGGDRLYLPVDRLNLVQKYLGVEGVAPRVEPWEASPGTPNSGEEGGGKIARELVGFMWPVAPSHHFCRLI